MPSVTINFTAANADRLKTALKQSLQLEDDATVEDLKTYIIADLKQLVRHAERREAQRIAMSNSDPVEIT